MKLKNLLIAFIAIAFCSSLQAQKYGHLNSQLIIQSLPEVKSADSELETYSQALIAKGQDMTKKYEVSYQAYAVKANGGEMSQVSMQQEEAKLGAQLQEIQKFEVEVQNLINAKKQEVYQPILDKIQVIIDQVGKEKGYTMIFDSSSLGMIFATESEDLMPLVKEKLGM